jgi:hypothetical protein
MPPRSALLSASVLGSFEHDRVRRSRGDQVADQVDAVVIVARDKAGLLEKQPSQTIFGIAKPLIETPRSASLVSDVTLERYGVLTLDGVTKVSPRDPHGQLLRRARRAQHPRHPGRELLPRLQAGGEPRDLFDPDRRGLAHRDPARPADPGLWRRQGRRPGQLHPQVGPRRRAASWPSRKAR